MIAIINYGSGNVSAIANIYRQLGVEHSVVSNFTELTSADKLILPGVGHFDWTMKSLKHSGLFDALNEVVLVKRKPVLGICVGMQILGETSEEGQESGLAWISGRVSRVDTEGSSIRLPHMGWNSVAIDNDPRGLFDNVDTTTGFYFLHSYHFVPSMASSVVASTDYDKSLVCAISNSENVFGVQFHPEKSHSNGITVFKNFAKL